MTRSSSIIQTIGGRPSREATFVKILALVDELMEQFAIMGHLHNTEDSNKDRLLAKGWLGMVELFQRIRHQIVALAQGRMSH